MIGTLNDSNCIGRGKGFFEPDFQRFLKTVAFDVMVVITLGSLSDAPCLCHFNARSARLAGPRVRPLCRRSLVIGSGAPRVTASTAAFGCRALPLSLPETTSDSIGGAGHRGWAPE
jgi:hypothetical protein